MSFSWLGKDHWGIEGKTGEQVPECPAGYLYCPGCSKVTKLRGINHQKNVWFGSCSCGYRITYRPKDMAIAYVDLSGILHSMGFESRSFSTYIGNHIKYPYA